MLFLAAVGGMIWKNIKFCMSENDEPEDDCFRYVPAFKTGTSWI